METDGLCSFNGDRRTCVVDHEDRERHNPGGIDEGTSNGPFQVCPARLRSMRPPPCCLRSICTLATPFPSTTPRFVMTVSPRPRMLGDAS